MYNDRLRFGIFLAPFHALNENPTTAPINPPNQVPEKTHTFRLNPRSPRSFDHMFSMDAIAPPISEPAIIPEIKPAST